MRLVMLDTETTGLRVEESHRLIEIGCIECVDRRVTERVFHTYLNPEREVDEGATQVHGLTLDQLRDKPRFEEVVDAFLDFIRDAQVVIHNAEFDRGFLNSELKRLGRPPLEGHVAAIIDSLAQARERHPGQRNSLDALCQRYSVSNEHRVLHGALLDARLLADVYMAMTRGQESLVMAADDDLEADPSFAIDSSMIVVRRASEQECAAHEAILQEIDKVSGGQTVWRHQNSNA